MRACFRDAADPKSRETSIPVSTSTGPDPDKPPAPSESALVPLARAEEDDEMMADVTEMAGGGQVSGRDALANLEVTLRPVEKYAVRLLEEVSNSILHLKHPRRLHQKCSETSPAWLHLKTDQQQHARV